ncbi:MAG: MlaD family protein [Mangrovibacterium sp.]
MKNKKYIKLGVLVISSIAIIIWGINFLKGIDIFKTSTTYYAKYNRVDGLVKSSSILINGFQVGLVQDVSFSDANDGTFVVELAVEGDFKIPQGSVAVLASNDLLGTKAIKFSLQKNSEYYQEGDTLISSIDGDMLELLGNEVIPIKDKAEQLIESLNSTMTALNTVLDTQTQENLKQSIAHFNATMQNLDEMSGLLGGVVAAQRKDISQIISHVDTLTSALAASSGNIKQVAENLSTITENLATSDLKILVNDLAAILTKIEDGKGTLGALVNDDSLYDNLDEMTESLNKLLIDFQNNPSKYLKLTAIDFGKDIYISSNELKSDEKYSFCILLLESSDRIAPNNPMFDGFDVELIESEDKYNYFTPKENSFQTLSNQLLKAKEQFPNAQIIAYKNGKAIRLDKALKALSKSNF